MGARPLIGLDVGSSRTLAVLAETGASEDAPLSILGVGQAATEGVERGVITHLEAASESIRTAAREAELMAGVETDAVYAGIAAAHAEVRHSTGVVAVGGREIAAADVRRVGEVGRAVAIAPDRELLHALPQEYVVDGRGGIRDPVGMAATRLESEVCLVTARSAACRDLRKAVEKAGYQAEELVLSPLASSLAALEDEERNEGVVLLELGAAGTEAIVFLGGKLQHLYSLRWGAETVTHDIAKGLGIPLEEASRLKETTGTALRRLADPAEKLQVESPGFGPPRRISRELLGHIIEQRLDEILGLVYDGLEDARVLEALGAGVVLTGGGALLPGMPELVRDVFHLPARLAEPGRGLAGLTAAVASPACAAGVGLVLYGSARENGRGRVGAGRLLSRVGEWLRDFF